MKRFCIQFMSGHQWTVEARADFPTMYYKMSAYQVTRLEPLDAGEYRKFEASFRPETVEGIWELST
jgi:hypothetical protein